MWVLATLILTSRLISLVIKNVLKLPVWSSVMAFHPLVKNDNSNKFEKRLSHLNYVMVRFKIWGNARLDGLKSIF